MNPRTYFQTMSSISERTDRIIADKLEKAYGHVPALHELVTNLPRRRAGRPQLRPALFVQAHKLFRPFPIREEEWNVPAALEMLNLSTYVLNYVLDEKGGEKSKTMRNNELIASVLLREQAQSLLLQRGASTTLDEYVTLNTSFSRINESTSGTGQFLDGNTLREVSDEYLEQYAARCEGLTGTFLGEVSRMGGISAGASRDEQELLYEFGRNLGIVVQIINDLGDFVPPEAFVGKGSVGKAYQDQYADLQHGTITFPTYWVLTQGNDEERAIVERVRNNREATLEECRAVTNAFVRLGGLEAVQACAATYARAAKTALHKLPAGEARDWLSTSLAIYRSNKFRTALKRTGLDRTNKLEVSA